MNTTTGENNNLLLRKYTLPSLIKFIIIYSYYTENDGSGIALNQEAIAKFLNRSKRNVIRQFNTLRNEGFITVIDKVKFCCDSNRRTDKTVWFSNLYSIDQEALNNFMIKNCKEDVLANIEEESKIYNDFLTQVYTDYAKFKASKAAEEAKLAEDETKLSDEEKKAIANNVDNKVKNEQKKMAILQKDNDKYLKILESVNEGKDIKMAYLDKNKKRLTCALCATKNPKKHKESTERMEMLHKFFSTDKDIEEFDTNASIYRLSYALGHRSLASHEEDIYKMVFDECGFVAEWTTELRDNFKYLLMPIYMREWAISFRCMTYERQSHWKKFYSKQTEKAFLFNKYFVDLFKMPLKTILTKLCDAMHKVFNLDNFYRANIFIHESNLHLIMTRMFNERGIETINVYDGFYFVKGTASQKIFDEVYDAATMELLSDYSLVEAA